MTPAKIAAAATNTNVPVANMKPIIRATPRISRPKPSIAPVGERARRRDEPELQRFKARIYERRCADFQTRPDSDQIQIRHSPSHARVRQIYDRRLSRQKLARH